MRKLGLYWWSPSRNVREGLWQLRRNHDAWRSMTFRGGRILQNFGDALSQRIVTEVTGRRVRWASPDSASVTAIGSVIEHLAAADSPGVVWGSGLRGRDAASESWAARRPSRFLAVRGADTRDALGLDPATPLGDPGLLVRTLFRRSRRRSGIVVLPHFLAFNNPDARKQLAIAKSRGMRVLVPSASYGSICEEVSRAELVLTSSLHGMVVADALDCPVQLVSFGPTAEPPFKFSDYQSVYGLRADFATFGDGVLDEVATSAVFDAAVVRQAEVSARIDGVVEGLVRSARSLADLD